MRKMNSVSKIALSLSVCLVWAVASCKGTEIDNSTHTNTTCAAGACVGGTGDAAADAGGTGDAAADAGGSCEASIEAKAEAMGKRPARSHLKANYGAILEVLGKTKLAVEAAGGVATAAVNVGAEVADSTGQSFALKFLLDRPQPSSVRKVSLACT